MAVEDAWAFERARMLVEAVTGEENDDVIVEAMLAETLTSILPPPRSGGGEALLAGLERAADGRAGRPRDNACERGGHPGRRERAGPPAL